MDHDPDEADRDVLEHGAAPGRLSEWGRSRAVRGVGVLVGTAALAWALAGADPLGSARPAAPADGQASRGSGAPDSPLAVLVPSERRDPRRSDHECESDGPGGGSGSAAASKRGRPAGLADRPGRSLAAAMRRFAAEPGPDAGVPWAPRVRVVAEAPGGTIVRLADDATVTRVGKWTTPSYLLADLAASPPATLRVDDEHHVTCRGQPRAQAAGLGGQPWVSVQPRVLANACRGWWAVDLYLDGRGRVATVIVRS